MATRRGRGSCPGKPCCRGRASGRRLESRADAETTIADNAGGVQQTVLGRVFADSASVFLGVSMVAVERGTSSHPVLTDGATATQVGKGAEKPGEAATVGIETLEPRRLSARYSFAVEDLARIDGLEEALRADLVGSLSEGMDSQVLSGNGVAPNVSGFLQELTAPMTPADTATYGLVLRAVAAGVDGRAARNLSEIRAVAGTDAYQFATGLVSVGAEWGVADYLQERSGGLRASSHVPAAPTSGNDSGIAGLLLYRTMAPSSAVAAIWQGLEMTIRDEVTAAAEGRIRLTGLAALGLRDSA